MIRRLAIITFLLSTAAQAQWVQSQLNAGLGRDLYSDGSTIYAASSQGVYYTSGAGDPWFNIGPADQDIFSIVLIGNKIIAGSTVNSGVFLSTDNGQHWYQPPTLSTGMVRTLAKGSTHVFAGEWAGGVWRSSDDGETWESAGLNGLGIVALYVVGNRLFAVEPNNPTTIHISTDNGDTWDASYLGYPAANPRSLLFDGNTLFALDVGLWASADTGKTWTLRQGVTFDSTGYPTKTRFFRNMVKLGNTFVAAIDFESIHTSTDNGFTWTSFNDSLISDWTFVDIAANGPYLWALTEFFGNAYRRPLTEVIADVHHGTDVPVSLTLGQNYPNPFNPSTTIQYTLAGVRSQASGVSEVRIVIYDVLGRAVATLVNGRQAPGTYEVKFDGSRLPSGVYFCHMTAGSFTKVRRMILAK